MRTFITVVLGLALAAWSVVSDANANEVREALERLIQHENREQRFVVIEDPASGKFMQFDMQHRQLMLDLPLLALSPEESTRASKLFASIGLDRPVIDVSTDPVTGQVQKTTTWRLGLGDDVEKAVALAERILREVYGFPARTTVVITEASR